MNDDQIDDLKQYLATTISQATAGMATRNDLMELQAHVDEQISDHEHRITILEQPAVR